MPCEIILLDVAWLRPLFGGIPIGIEHSLIGAWPVGGGLAREVYRRRGLDRCLSRKCIIG